MELHLLHQAPLRFAKRVISLDENVAVVSNEFSSVPSLGMLVEAAAQSSAAFSEKDEQRKMGYLASLKNIKLITPPTSLYYDIHITLGATINNIGHFSFEAKQSDEVIASGSFVVVSV